MQDIYYKLIIHAVQFPESAGQINLLLFYLAEPTRSMRKEQKNIGESYPCLFLEEGRNSEEVISRERTGNKK